MLTRTGRPPSSRLGLPRVNERRAVTTVKYVSNLTTKMTQNSDRHRFVSYLTWLAKYETFFDTKMSCAFIWWELQQNRNDYDARQRRNTSGNQCQSIRMWRGCFLVPERLKTRFVALLRPSMYDSNQVECLKIFSYPCLPNHAENRHTR